MARRRRTKAWRLRRDADIVKARRAGLTVRYLARAYGLSPGRIRQIVKAAGWQPPGREWDTHHLGGYEPPR